MHVPQVTKRLYIRFLSPFQAMNCGTRICKVEKRHQEISCNSHEFFIHLDFILRIRKALRRTEQVWFPKKGNALQNTKWVNVPRIEATSVLQIHVVPYLGSSFKFTVEVILVLIELVLVASIYQNGMSGFYYVDCTAYFLVLG